MYLIFEPLALKFSHFSFLQWCWFVVNYIVKIVFLAW
uniref:PDZ domain-containing protein n=1 Tax=Mesocestoides corti TaxID=53468 RepID=A0A5K3EWU3_MESCO